MHLFINTAPLAPVVGRPAQAPSRTPPAVPDMAAPDLSAAIRQASGATATGRPAGNGFQPTENGRYDELDFSAPGRHKKETSVAIDETKLKNGQLRNLNGLGKSVGDSLPEEVFRKRMTQQAKAAILKANPVAATKIEQALAGFMDDRTFSLGNYRYTV